MQSVTSVIFLNMSLRGLPAIPLPNLQWVLLAAGALFAMLLTRRPQRS